MKLVCPHCSKVIDVDERLAGQTTNCPQCQGPFTVPIAPSDAADELVEHVPGAVAALAGSSSAAVPVAA